MANPEHVALAKSGANAIARWRETHYRIPNPTLHSYSLRYQLEDRSTSENFEPEFVYGRSKLDLAGAYLTRIRLAGADLSYDDLRGADLTGCNLRQANLAGTNFNSAHLSRSNLSRTTLTRASMTGCSMIRSDLSSSTLELAQLAGANLSFSNLSYTNLERADLSNTDLSFADLSWANLRHANLRGANLTTTSLRMADLTGADLRDAYIFNADLESTIFQNAVLGITKLINCDLSKTICLEMTRHTGPSAIGLDTFARSGGMLPKVFLENAGVAAPVIAAQDALRGSRRIYPSVLIVGSKGDAVLADRIRAGLLACQVPSWSISADDEDAQKSGDMILSHSIYYDRLVLLCTAQSLESSQTSQYFFELASSHSSETDQTLAVVAADDVFYDRSDRLCTMLGKGLVLDFRGWEDAQNYKEAFAALAKALCGESP
ncbi:MAG: pentapeptide repeat-containing protein [Chloroflexi bacterium]|nr:pentapeptide repeat-containing protein [Chloroflexota bacterium]MDA1219383.1 pentapeptide repeat-containing protein [Chloroflexota bacterium]PKB57669.1 MAG: hypothetical protein BZY73_02075 [SAR202 cluster bacterium Casp-Chloro-G3]